MFKYSSRHNISPLMWEIIQSNIKYYTLLTSTVMVKEECFSETSATQPTYTPRNKAVTVVATHTCIHYILVISKMFYSSGCTCCLLPVVSSWCWHLSQSILSKRFLYKEVLRNETITVGTELVCPSACFIFECRVISYFGPTTKTPAEFNLCFCRPCRLYPAFCMSI
jgi:hypothetical protein